MIGVLYTTTHTAIAFAMDTLRTTQCVCTATHMVIAVAMTRLRDTHNVVLCLLLPLQRRLHCPLGATN